MGSRLTAVLFSLTSAGLNRGNILPPIGTPPTGGAFIPSVGEYSLVMLSVTSSSPPSQTQKTHVSLRGVMLGAPHLNLPRAWAEGSPVKEMSPLARPQQSWRGRDQSLFQPVPSTTHPPPLPVFPPTKRVGYNTEGRKYV